MSDVHTAAVAPLVLTATGFDYEQLDTETRDVVQEKTSEIKILAQKTAQTLIDIGNNLIDVKARLKHGQFQQWLSAEFDWTPRYARQLIAVAQRFGDAENGTLFRFGTSALRLLAAPSTPDAARHEAIDRAKSGEKVTHKVAKQIKAAHSSEYDSAEHLVRAYANELDDQLRNRALHNIKEGKSSANRHVIRLFARGNRAFDTVAIREAASSVLYEIENPTPPVTIIEQSSADNASADNASAASQPLTPSPLPPIDLTPEYTPLGTPFTIYHASISDRDGTLIWTEFKAQERHLDEAYICRTPSALHGSRISDAQLADAHSGYALAQLDALTSLNHAVSAERADTQTAISQLQQQIDRLQQQIKQHKQRVTVLDTGAINIGNARAALQTPPNTF